jgi:hypothetical protein
MMMKSLITRHNLVLKILKIQNVAVSLAEIIDTLLLSFKKVSISRFIQERSFTVSVYQRPRSIGLVLRLNICLVEESIVNLLKVGSIRNALHSTGFAWINIKSDIVMIWVTSR